MALIDLDHRRSLYDDPLPQFIVMPAPVGAQHGARYFIARKCQRPFFVQKQIRPRRLGQPLGAVALVQPFAQGDSRFAQNAGQIAERINDARSRPVIRGEEIRRPGGSMRGAPPSSPRDSFQHIGA